jgi:hypothetical protein
VDVQANTTSSFADHGALLECVIDTFNRVVFHTDEETRAKLWVWRPSVEKCRRCMSKVSFGHEMVGFGDPFDISSVNANSDTHDHVLGSLSYSTVDSQQIRSLEGFETKA